MMKKDTPGRSGKTDKEKGYKKSASGRPARDDKKPSPRRGEQGEDRPKRSFNSEDKPKRSFGEKRDGKWEDRPKRSFGDDKPKGKWEDRPKRSFGEGKDEDRPKRSFSNDKPKGKWEDRPKRSFGEGKGEDRPKRSFSSDKPKGKWEDRPKRNFGEEKSEDRPKRSFSSDKPKGKWEDRPKRSFGDEKNEDRPKRSFSSDKPKGKWEDRPKRSFGEEKGEDKPKRREHGDKPFEKKDKKSFGKPGGQFKPSFKKKETEQRPFPFSDIKVSGPFRKGYQADKPTKPEKAGRKRKEKDEPAEKDLTLNTYIAHSGVCSRRDAAELVKQGKVKVNDELMLDPGYRVQPYDQVTIAGKKLVPQKNRVYILLNKPKDYITTTEDPEGRKTVMELVDNAGVDRLFPVGRLDRQTTGLLLLTNDGDLAQKLSHPSHEIKKVYQVTLDKNLTKAHFEQIVAGVELEDGMAHVDALAYLETKNELGLEIHSGRNRIVRRIFESLGYTVEKLDRVMYAGLTKKNLPRGKWRFLQDKEVILLKHFKN